jgi:predicted amidohydrolase YtcJ
LCCDRRKASAPERHAPIPHADLILDHGTVVTLDRASHIAEALAIRDGHITAVGSSAALAREAGRGRGGSRIVSLAAKTRLPAMYTASDWPREGGLMSYAEDRLPRYRRAASYVDRIFRCAKSIEQP